VPLTVEMISGPQDVVAVFTSAFKDVTTDTSTEFTQWTLNRQSGTFFGTMRFCNNPGSGVALREPFWYEVQPTANYRLMHPDGTNVLDGLPYVDITAQVLAQLPDDSLDPGECVTVTGIEFYFRTRVPVSGFVYAMWADPPVPVDFDELAADTDRDGIANGWEDDHDLNRNNPGDSLLDPDGDGYTSLEEYFADTDPQDSESYLRLLDARIVNGRVQLEWSGGEATSPYASPRPGSGAAWQRLPGMPEGSGTRSIESDAGDSGSGFYRIQAP